MTKPPDHVPLFPDEETVALEVMGPKRARDWPEKARFLEDKQGLPRVDEFMGGRFWPAVVEYFRVRYGVKLRDGLDGGVTDVPSSKSSSSIRIVPYKADGKEQYDGPEASPALGRRHRGRGHR